MQFGLVKRQLVLRQARQGGFKNLQNRSRRRLARATNNGVLQGGATAPPLEHRVKVRIFFGARTGVQDRIGRSLRFHGNQT